MPDDARRMNDEQLDEAIARRIGEPADAAPRFSADDNEARLMREWISKQGTEAISTFSAELLSRIPHHEWFMEDELLRTHARPFYNLDTHPRLQAEAFCRAFCSAPEP